jgi:hypothetical protein
VRDARSPRGTSFPDTRDGQPFADDLSHIAHLEAQRYQGHRHLVVPEGSRPWFRQQAELRDHVERAYLTAADVAGAGTVFDLTRAAAPGTDTLRSAVDRLTAGAPDPAVLDWTDLDLANELRDRAVFRPPESDHLPYLDQSIDVVVVDSSRDHGEATRVAALGVITVTGGPSGARVDDVTDLGSRAVAAQPRAVVWASADPADPRWIDALAERVAAAGAELHVGPLSAAGLSELPSHDVVLAVETHVLPLPGSIEAAVALAVERPEAAIAGKVVRADGHLESAGGTVFFDRSVALIAEGSNDVRAPWHELTRPVCWSPGLLGLSGSLAARVPAPEDVAGRAFLRELCASVWASSGSVLYQPTVTAVRVTGDGGEPSTPLTSSAWQRVLDFRPARPDNLSDGAWRFLLAHDDVEACRR